MQSQTTSIIATLRVVIGLAVVPAYATPNGVESKPRFPSTSLYWERLFTLANTR